MCSQELEDIWEEASDSSEDTAEFLSIAGRINKYFGVAPIPAKVDFGAKSDVGAVRTSNEDHFLVVKRQRHREILLTNISRYLLPVQEEDAYAMVVADGMGGTAFGHLASELALRTAWELGSKEINWPLKTNKEEVRQLMEKLEIYPLLIQQALAKQAREQPQLEGMGTTLTAIYSLGNHAYIAHVGDSRAYLLRGTDLHCLTTDHTVAQKLIDAGVYSADSDEIQHLHHMLTNCLDTDEGHIHVETHQMRLADGDRLLLCTDGLTNTLDEHVISQVISSEPTPQTACDRLVDLACQAGAKDNVTAVIGAYRIQPEAA